MSREVMQMALDAMLDSPLAYRTKMQRQAITALREELDHIPNAGKMVKVQRVPVSIAQILKGFPLLDDEGIDEEENYWKWALQQDRKLLHAMLTALPQRQPITEERLIELFGDGVNAIVFRGIARMVEKEHDIEEKE